MTNRRFQRRLDSTLQAIEGRDGRSQQLIADSNGDAAQEGMYREAICQILANERFSRRFRFLLLYPEIIVPYFVRIKNS
jgi:hypothetical protein